MNKQNIEQIIRELFAKNFELYPNYYPLTNEGLMSDEGAMSAQSWAKGAYANRTQGEIEQESAIGATEIDYVEWVMAELSDLIPAAPEMDIDTSILK